MIAKITADMLDINTEGSKTPLPWESHLWYQKWESCCWQRLLCEDWRRIRVGWPVSAALHALAHSNCFPPPPHPVTSPRHRVIRLLFYKPPRCHQTMASSSCTRMTALPPHSPKPWAGVFPTAEWHLPCWAPTVFPGFPFTLRQLILY